MGRAVADPGSIIDGGMVAEQSEVVVVKVESSEFSHLMVMDKIKKEKSTSESNRTRTCAG